MSVYVAYLARNRGFSLIFTGITPSSAPRMEKSSIWSSVLRPRILEGTPHLGECLDMFSTIPTAAPHESRLNARCSVERNGGCGFGVNALSSAYRDRWTANDLLRPPTAEAHAAVRSRTLGEVSLMV